MQHRYLRLAWRSIVPASRFAIVLLLASAPVGAQVINESVCPGVLCNNLDCPVIVPAPAYSGFGQWISLPGSTPITSAEELLRSIPKATSVAKRFPRDGACDVYQWDGVTRDVEIDASGLSCP
jgi:hypothetical protein